MFGLFCDEILFLIFEELWFVLFGKKLFLDDRGDDVRLLLFKSGNEKVFDVILGV